MKLRIKDEIEVIAGKDKGRRGKITRVIPKKGSVIVEGINTYKRHLKPQGKDKPCGIIQIERAIDVSKVKLISPITGKPTRIGIERDNTGAITRICKQSKKPIDK